MRGVQLKNIEKLIRRTGSADLIYTDDCVWIYNGYVKAPLFSFRELSEEQFWSVFNIPEKKRADFVVTRRASRPDEAPLFEDTYHDEEQLTWNDELSINYGGMEAVPMLSKRGQIYADARDLSPFFKEDSKAILCARWPEGEVFPVIAVKSGMFLKGLIQPAAEHVIRSGFCDTIELLAKKTRDVLKTGYLIPGMEGNNNGEE